MRKAIPNTEKLKTDSRKLKTKLYIDKFHINRQMFSNTMFSSQKHDIFQ